MPCCNLEVFGNVFHIFICDIITEIFKTVNLFSIFIISTYFSANGVFPLKNFISFFTEESSVVNSLAVFRRLITERCYLPGKLDYLREVKYLNFKFLFRIMSLRDVSRHFVIILHM
jgi:hypothetical protein